MARATIDFGIDLGTTNSSIALVDQGRVRIFKDRGQRDTVPSVVRIDRAGGVTVGPEAYNKLEDDPENTAAEFKRLMGTAHEVCFAAANRTASPEMLSSEVLKRLRDNTRRAGFDCDAAVITVPAYFEIIACEATQRAAELAGLVAAPLLQEPVAAAIAAGIEGDPADGYWLIYDLGGGTFDAAIVSQRSRHLSVVDCDGDNNLGGKDFDWLIVERLLIPRLASEFNVPHLSRANRTRYASLLAKLKHVAEEMKISLTDSVEASHYLDGCGADADGRPIELPLRVTRAEYEPLIEPHLQETVGLCRRLLQRAQLNPAAISQIVLVGGPTMTPALRSMLQDSLRIRLSSRFDPMTIVAQGAAIFASSQAFPEAQQRRTAGRTLVKLSFSALSQQQTTMVAGRLEEGATQNAPLRIHISRDDRGWESGALAINDGVFVAPVALRENQANVFRLNLVDRTGNAVPIEPETFCITHGLSVGNPPLQRTIGVEVLTAGDEGRFEIMLKRGTPLPAKATQTFRAARTLQPGDGGSVLNIHVLEGEHEVPGHNRHLGTLRIDARKISRAIPAGADIEVTLSIDASRRPRAQAYVPLLDETFHELLENLIAPRVDLERLANDFREAREQWMAEGSPDATVVANMERQITSADTELAAASGGDAAALEKADRLVREIQAQLASHEVAAALPRLLQDVEEAKAETRKVVAEHGNAADQAQLFALEQDADRARDRRDSALCQAAKDRLWQLYWGVLTRHDGFWIGMFQDLTERGKFRDQARADTLITEAAQALQRHDMNRFRDLTRELWALLPRQEQRATTRRVSDAGIK